MQLDLDPANSLMVADWPNFNAYSLDDTKLALSRLINTVKNYDVKKLLVYGTNVKLNVESEAYEEIVKHFMQLLHTTKLEKIARIMTTDADRENRVKNMEPHLLGLIRLQNFSTAAEARAWLLNPDS